MIDSSADNKTIDIPGPLVSIMLVCYNFECFFVEAIEAILAQDFTDYEIIICDDCSTDSTRALAVTYKQLYPEKIVLSFTTHNVGATKNLNQGLSLARGRYICHTSGDDVFLPGKLRRQVDYLESNPKCVILYHDQIVFYTEEPDKLLLNSQIEKPRCGNVRAVVAYGTFAGGPSIMVRRSNPTTLQRESIRYAADWIYQVDCLSVGGTIDYIPDVLSKYRRHSANVSSRFALRNNIDNVRSIVMIIMSYPQLGPWALFRLYSGVLNVFTRLLRRVDFYDFGTR
jgi:glycosyltransferase involved in cell wall biosynthesis